MTKWKVDGREQRIEISVKDIRKGEAPNFELEPGDIVDGFESEPATYVGVAHAAALSSGTAASHLALGAGAGWREQGRPRVVVSQFGTANLVRIYRMITQDVVRTKNRIKSIYRSRGIQTAGRTDLYKPKRRLEVSKVLQPATRYGVELLCWELDSLF